jgi:hypothetical protein
MPGDWVWILALSILGVIIFALIGLIIYKCMTYRTINDKAKDVIYDTNSSLENNLYTQGQESINV